jgi:hypothetical protein
MFYIGIMRSHLRKFSGAFWPVILLLFTAHQPEPPLNLKNLLLKGF